MGPDGSFGSWPHTLPFIATETCATDARLDYPSCTTEHRLFWQINRSMNDTDNLSIKVSATRLIHALYHASTSSIRLK